MSRNIQAIRLRVLYFGVTESFAVIQDIPGFALGEYLEGDEAEGRPSRSDGLHGFGRKTKFAKEVDGACSSFFSAGLGFSLLVSSVVAM